MDLREIVNLCLIVSVMLVICIIPAMGDDKTSAYWLDKANRYYNAGSYDIVLLAVNKSLELDPSNIEAWKLKGDSFSALNMSKNALVCYSKVIELNTSAASIFAPKSGIAAPETERYYADQQYIQANFAGKFYSIMGYSSPDPGKKFLVIDLTIENHGYDSFDTDPYRFKVTADKVQYDIAGASYYLDSIGKAMLDSVTLRDGGKISGFLAYKFLQLRLTTHSPIPGKIMM